MDPGRLLDLLDEDVESIKPAIPGWRVTGVAGEGGSGLVWKAEREADGSTAAIKIASPDEPDTVERIEREARFLRDLRHPHIVRLLDAGPLSEGSDEGGLYLAMEFIDGPALSQEIPEQGLPPDKAYMWFREIADAVAHAHDCGILHRDLKPANVLIADDGHVKVADFGLARPVYRRVHMLSLTRAGQVAGTAEYLPPEAYRRDYQPGPEADIFALGVMLHEMLTGTPPRGAWLPASSRRGVDVRIDDLVRRAMDPDPTARWPNARAMLAELERITGSSPRYSGTPLVTFPIRVADCLWTVLGLLVFVSSLSSLLTLRKAKFSLPLDLVGDHRLLVGGFNALFLLLLPCIPLALWQIIRLRRFRHIPMREALPSPFGVKLGLGRSAAWLVTAGQLFCFLLPLLQLLTIYTDTCLSWLEPDDPPWVHGLAVTTWGNERELLSPWKFYPGTRFWLHEIEGPPGHPLASYLDRVGFLPGYVPLVMVVSASLMGLALLVTLFTASRGWWLRGRRLHVIASLTLFGIFGTTIGKGHHGRFVIIDKEHNRPPDLWVGGRMTGQMRALARQIIGARASEADAAALRDTLHLYAPVVDFHEHGR
ncbi:MAG TPA: serine/threonine-protein kinase, partial [Luteolibacter sp.]|nr:serine/threonine-protein kinase [Luteolibacter sp.]